MQGKWSIEGFDLSPWLIEGGVSYSQDARQSREVVTLAGTLHRKEVRKRRLSLSLVTMSDGTLRQLMEHIPQRGSMEYLDANGQQSTRTFYFTAPQYSAKTVRGGVTYYSGLTLEAEER